MLSEEKPSVCVIGLGYIGLPTAAVIARSGCPVLGIDINEQVVDTINSGKIHIEEVDLDGLVQGVVSRNMLRASLTVEPSDVFVIAVPTPFGENHIPDTSFVMTAATNIAKDLKTGDTVILESTCPVGTTEKMRDLIAELRPDLKIPGLTQDIPDIAIAYCPERVLPGRILEELIQNDRSIGGITSRCARKALGFYRRFVRGELVTTSARAAEMTKLVENSYRDVNIAFANELSIIADHMDLDVWEVIRLANRHPRVNILQPGPGVGGHCIAVDPWFIIHSAPEQSPLIRIAREVNDGKIGHVLEQASLLIDELPDESIACFGLAFKANIDDFRESPALKISAKLAKRYPGRIKIVEPYASKLPAEFKDMDAELIDIDQALETCPIIITLTDHDMFKSIPLDERVSKVVYDTRGIWPDQPDNFSAINELKPPG
ncbi:UDP-N-acetyl-D-mannosamine dehydrogenase [Parasphingorhabdus sp.]|uniref:UDP-N-acetyl-D-mannosamine dehydrogenase n=1 Tax=Parasphingorhabdus sp. TaxID=2709688 RepID=UPI003265551D